MEMQELISICKRAIDNYQLVRLVLPRKPTGEGIRLNKTNGPIGRVICVNGNDHTVAAFDPVLVLSWLKKNNLTD